MRRLTQREMRALNAAVSFTMAGEYPFEDETEFSYEDMQRAAEKLQERLKDPLQPEGRGE